MAAPEKSAEKAPGAAPGPSNVTAEEPATTEVPPAAPPEVEGRGKHTFQALQALYDSKLGLIPAGGYFRAYKSDGRAKSHLARLVPDDEDVPANVKAALGL